MPWPTLSTDLKAIILGQLSRPSDLKQCCLVSKGFHELAVKHLYRKVALHIGTDQDENLVEMLSPQNIGLKYIREVFFALNHPLDSNPQQAQLMLRMVLLSLPRDVLECFICGHDGIMTGKIQLLLFTRQRQLREFHVVPLAHPVDRENLEKALRDLKKLRSLDITLNSRVSLTQAQVFSESLFDDLERLYIGVDVPGSGRGQAPIMSHFDGEDVQNLYDTATAPGLLTRTIFAHKMPFQKYEPFRSLTNLELENINLRHCEDSWCRFISFGRLKQLRLRGCPGVDALLDRMSRAQHLPAKLQCLMICHNDNSENEVLLALEHFLSLVTCIQTLSIVLDNVSRLPSVAGVRLQKSQLRALSIHANPASPLQSGFEKELCYSMDDFADLCKTCTLLEQLSCAWPEIPVTASGGPGARFKAFEAAILRPSHASHLKTLHVSNWPASSSTVSTKDAGRDVYLLRLQYLALRQFKVAIAHRCEVSPDHISPLRSIAYGTWGADEDTLRAHHRYDYGSNWASRSFLYTRYAHLIEPALFVRSTCVSAEGTTELYAARTSDSRKCYTDVANHADILDLVPMRPSPLPYRVKYNARNRWGSFEGDEMSEVNSADSSEVEI